MPGFLVDGNDVLAVHQAVQEAIERGNKESRPTLLDCRTYRWRGHSEKEKQETDFVIVKIPRRPAIRFLGTN